MKFKPFALLLARGAFLVSCGSNNQEPASSSSTDPSASTKLDPTYLSITYFVVKLVPDD